MSQTTIPVPADLSAALERVKHALGAMGGGDPAPYAALWRDDGDVTLFGAWGPIELRAADAGLARRSATVTEARANRTSWPRRP